ncbi:MAG TPA: FAD:protein FMN transferase [Candidatus Omnitrophota bacterium]|nr:FAD:protein FMN transferase [Candidatus Omnitrophota bacterium]
MKRRRFLRIAAAAGLVAASPARAFRLQPVEWRGVAIGAPASLTIDHEDRAEGLRLAQACMAEIERLEQVFSLYRESALVRLNRDGFLDTPPLDLVRLLGMADRFRRATGGAFDPTVQPLWQLHARHFAQPGADPAGPPLHELERARALVGWRDVAVDPARIEFRRPGMAVTLNGIAQGYVTDKVADLLRRAGMRHVLVNMGEIAAIGRWRVGMPDGTARSLADRALAVSDPDGTRFSPLCHHIFDPASGRSAAGGGWVAACADTAAEADALSTAMAISGGGAR